MGNSIVTAGTHQSGDVFVRIKPGPRQSIKLVSPVRSLIVDFVTTLVSQALEVAGIQSVSIELHDSAASEWILRARLQTAISRWKAAGI